MSNQAEDETVARQIFLRRLSRQIDLCDMYLSLTAVCWGMLFRRFAGVTKVFAMQ